MTYRNVGRARTRWSERTEQLGWPSPLHQLAPGQSALRYLCRVISDHPDFSLDYPSPTAQILSDGLCLLDCQIIEPRHASAHQSALTNDSIENLPVADKTRSA